MCQRYLLIIFSALSVISFGKDRKVVDFQRISEEVTLDGVLDESFWATCTPAEQFIQNQPVAGADPTRPSQVRVAYDDAAVYIGATLFDDRDSMSLTLSQRDDFGNADWFGVVIDPYDAGTIGFAFLVTSAGVQIDELHQVNDIDGNWNAVWQSEVRVTDTAWYAEIRIPFSAIRFPKRAIQQWGVNFARNIRRNREQSYWNNYDPEGINLISQLGGVTGLENIESPIRLSVTPYVSGYVENFDGNTGYTVNGGMDLKYGLNEAFTLDLTLIPDFGQVQFDNQVLNLSPFEVQFNENRQFFTEGTELFNKLGVFYSRRVGGRPINLGNAAAERDSNEVILENPTVTPLLNAAKLSGRTQKGTGIGIFNAISREADATLRDTLTGEERMVQTSPLSNYNVFVIDQNLKNNSSLTFTQTSVLREGTTYDAGVSAFGANLYSKNQRYNTGGNLAVSQLYSDTGNTFGYKYSAWVGKASGKFVWELNYNESNDTYDQNDLGFQTTNNLRWIFADIGMNNFKPFWRFYRTRLALNTGVGQLVNPNEFSEFYISFEGNGTFRNFMTAGFWGDLNPIPNQDWFEPRVPGRFYEGDRFYGGGAFISSDYSKPFALDARLAGGKFSDVGRYNIQGNVSPRFRFNDQFSLIFQYNVDYSQNDEGVALTRFFAVPMDGDDPIFAKRDRLTMTSTLSGDYIFTNRMGVTLRLRHYWSNVIYNSFYRLDADGQFSPTAYTGVSEEGNSIHDNNFNAFTIDFVYRWVFAPGSELSLVWKNSVFTSSADVETDYFRNLEELTQSPATNSLSFKLLYYIDFWETRNYFRAR